MGLRITWVYLGSQLGKQIIQTVSAEHTPMHDFSYLLFLWVLAIRITNRTKTTCVSAGCKIEGKSVCPAETQRFSQKNQLHVQQIMQFTFFLVGTPKKSGLLHFVEF